MLDSLVDEIVDSCINLYEKLPKTGKPIENEWTVLSCIIQFDTESKHNEVVALGTGSKCIGASKMSPEGNILNDSHAEVIARRSLLKYLYENIIYLNENKKSIFIKDKEKYILKSNYEFIFYSSQMPCGDASIMLKADGDDDYGQTIVSNKREAEDTSCNIEKKRPKFDIHRTGAKCLPDTDQDLKEPGENYHLLSQVRTKPGRGDRTLSVSCSDKLARWIHVGIQGALLDLLLSEPIFIKHFIFGAGVPYCEKSLERALLWRNCNIDLDKRLICIPKFYKSSKMFSCVRNINNNRAAPASIIWNKIMNNITEVAVHGKKLGVTKKKQNSLCSSLSVSKYCLYKIFHQVLLKNEELIKSVCGKEIQSQIQYNKMKNKAEKYQAVWCKTQQDFFKIWTKKPDMWNFCLKM